MREEVFLICVETFIALFFVLTYRLKRMQIILHFFPFISYLDILRGFYQNKKYKQNNSAVTFLLETNVTPICLYVSKCDIHGLR